MQHIKPLQQKQVQDVADLWLRSVILGHPFINESYWRSQYEKIKTEYLPNSKTYIYCSNEKVQGFLSIIKGNTIGALFVDVDCQGKGIGTALLKFAKTRFPVLHLCVYQNNTAALTFYMKHGFLLDDQRVDESTGQIEYAMTWR